MPGRWTILIVSCEAGTRQVLTEQLSKQVEFDVNQVETVAEARELLRTNHHDLVVMDVRVAKGADMPDVAVLREGGFHGPIVALAAEESQGLQALEAGTSDYIVMPLRFAVLLARMRAQLRQYEASENVIFSVGPFSFRPALKVLVAPSGERIKLTEKETSILRYLYRRGQKPVSRDILLEEVWGYNSGVSTHTLETHIYRLRQKIELDPSNATLLVTEAGGYKLVP